jgi:Nuclease A inhibitor-like protein
MSNSSPEVSVTTAEIIDRLTQATTDLLWSSESDCPWEIVTWAQGTEITPITLFGDLDVAELAIESMLLADLFAPVITVEDWYEEAELAIVDRYKALLATIEANLSAVQVFRIGEIEVAIYIVGKTPTGDIIGLKTHSIET